jgi:acyl carrier protein
VGGSRTSTGKSAPTKRHITQENALSDILRTVETLLSSPDLNLGSPDGSATLSENGVSSFRIIQLIMAIEDEINDQFSDDLIQRVLSAPLSAIPGMIEQTFSRT